MELFLPDQIVLNETSNALISDVEEAARRVNKSRPLPAVVVKRIEDGLRGERVYGSNAIEGNTLDLRETETVLKTGRLIENRMREAIEARNLGKADARISQLRPEGTQVHSVDRLLEVHKLILCETQDDYWGGRFRESGVTIAGAKYQPPDYSMVQALVERVMDRLKSIKDLPGLLRACWVHWALARIHPFKDGNGRIARLWQDLVLLQENLTCAIIRPEQRREYLDALSVADEGDFNGLLQFTAQQVLRTFDKYLAAIEADRELSKSATEIAGEVDARSAEKRKLAFQRWVRKMEQLCSEFEVFAGRINNESKSIGLQIRKGDMIDQTQWENLRRGTSAGNTRFFTLWCDPRERRRNLGYRFFFAKHYVVSKLDDAVIRSENRVCLLISEDDGKGEAVRLDKIVSCPISVREIFVVRDEFVVRRHDGTTREMRYERGIAPMQIAQNFIEEVLLRRLT